MSESFKSKVTGFKSILFFFITVVMGFYIYACSEDDKLIALQGLMLAWMGVAGAVIGLREMSKIKKMGDKK